MIHISVLVMGLQCLNVLGVDDHDTSRRGRHINISLIMKRKQSSGCRRIFTVAFDKLGKY